MNLIIRNFIVSIIVIICLVVFLFVYNIFGKQDIKKLEKQAICSQSCKADCAWESSNFYERKDCFNNCIENCLR